MTAFASVAAGAVETSTELDGPFEFDETTLLFAFSDFLTVSGSVEPQAPSKKAVAEIKVKLKYLIFFIGHEIYC